MASARALGCVPRPRARANERAVAAEQRACVGDVLVGPLSVALRGFFGHARSP